MTKRIGLIAALLLTLSGCSGVADALGFGRNPPDEFAVVERPPLAMPPDFELRPPKPGAPRPQEVSMPERASAVLLGPATKKAGSASESETALLSAAGAAKADPAIRTTVDREAAQKVAGSKHLVDDLLWWRDNRAPATTVDATSEAQRLREAKEKGETINKGATPIIERKKSGWLGL